MFFLFTDAVIYKQPYSFIICSVFLSNHSLVPITGQGAVVLWSFFVKVCFVCIGFYFSPAYEHAHTFSVLWVYLTVFCINCI